MIRAAVSVFSGDKAGDDGRCNGFDPRNTMICGKITEKQHSLLRLCLHGTARIRADMLNKM
jgi:hypothetical protein